jgi:hypothetical protein
MFGEEVVTPWLGADAFEHSRAFYGFRFMRESADERRLPT